MKRIIKCIMGSVMVLAFMLSLFLAVAFATEPAGSGTEADPYMYEVGSAAELGSAVSDINSKGSADETIYFNIYLKNDFNAGTTESELKIVKNHVTIFGDNHTLTVSNSFSLSGKAVLEFGAEDYKKTMKVQSNDDTKCVIHLNDQSTLNMYDNVTIGPSRSGGQAGGVQLAGSSVFNMYGGTITECTNWASVAGGVVASGSSEFHMYSGTISKCTGKQGGGVLLDDYAVMTMSGGRIEQCEAYYYGGGILAANALAIGGEPGGSSASFTMTGGVIEDCSSDYYGGGICIWEESATARLEGGSIVDCYALKYGGGVFAYKGNVTISDGFKLYDNTASSAGDDICNFAKLTLGAASAGSILDCGHPIDGWYDDGTDEARWSCTAPTEKYTRTGELLPSGYALKAAHGTIHTVTFDTQGGSTVDIQDVISGTAAKEPDAPTKDHFVFDGWYRNQLCTESYDFSTPVTGDITLYAKWVSASPKYILKYCDGRPDDGGEPYTYTYDPGNPVSLPSEVRYFSQEEIEQLPGDKIYEGVTAEGTYFLAWYGYMPVSASSVNNEFPVYEKTAENVYTEFSGTPVEGTTYYQFIPCDTTPDTNLGDITYYAQWIKVKIDITVNIEVDVNVSFDQSLNGNIVMIDDSQKQELAKNFKSSDIVGNNCEITLTATVSNPKSEAEKNKIEEYLLENYPNGRSISYDVEIKKDIKSNGTLYSSTILKELEAPIEIIFAVPQEWQGGTVKMLRAHTDAHGVTTIYECEDLDDSRSTFTVSSNQFSTYTLVYIPSGGGTKTGCTLRYQANGGTSYPDEKKSSAWIKNYSDLPVPVREGYTFTGWYEDSALKTPVSGDLQINRTLVTIYAGWEKGTVPDILNGNDHYSYVQGYTDGTVRPYNNITRAEVASVFFRLLKDDIRDTSLSDTNTFADVTEENWYNKAVSTMASLGIVRGRNSECFDPDAPITRSEFAAICARFDQTDVVIRNAFTDISECWAKEEIERAAVLGWIRGYEDGSFRPQDNITRAEAVTMINRVLQRIPEYQEDLLPDMITWPDNRPSDWYYLSVQEATNSHDFARKNNGYESWSALKENRNWSIYQ